MVRSKQIVLGVEFFLSPLDARLSVGILSITVLLNIPRPCCTCLVLEPHVPACARRHIVHESASAFIIASLVVSDEPSFVAPTPTPVEITLTVKRGLSIGYATSPGSSASRWAVMPS